MGRQRHGEIAKNSNHQDMVVWVAPVLETECTVISDKITPVGQVVPLYCL